MQVYSSPFSLFTLQSKAAKNILAAFSFTWEDKPSLFPYQSFLSAGAKCGLHGFLQYLHKDFPLNFSLGGGEEFLIKLQDLHCSPE